MRISVPSDFSQVQCKDRLTARCYWEVEWKGDVLIGVSYKRMKWSRNERFKTIYPSFLEQYSDFKPDTPSWTLRCCENGYFVRNQMKWEQIPLSASSMSDRVAVYVDHPAGIISFYQVSHGELLLLYTFQDTFTELLYPSFGLGFNSSVSLCKM